MEDIVVQLIGWDVHLRQGTNRARITPTVLLWNVSYDADDLVSARPHDHLELAAERISTRREVMLYERLVDDSYFEAVCAIAVLKKAASQ